MDHGITDVEEFLHIWGTAADNIFVVGLHDDDVAGERGIVYHFDEISWEDMGVKCTDLLHNVGGSSDASIFAVGGYGALLHYPVP